NANVRRGNAHRVAIEFAFEGGDDQVQGFGSARGAGDHVDRSGAGAAKILVRQVEELLIVGVGVNRGHGAGGDAESVLQNLGDGREAVGRARSVRNDVVLGGIVGVVIDAQHEGRVRTVGRG